MLNLTLGFSVCFIFAGLCLEEQSQNLLIGSCLKFHDSKVTETGGTHCMYSRRETFIIAGLEPKIFVFKSSKTV